MSLFTDIDKKNRHLDFFNSCRDIIPLSYFKRVIKMYDLDLNYQDDQGKTYLFYLIDSDDNYEIIEYVLTNLKPNLEFKNHRWGNTVLNHACQFSNFEIVELLLKYGADTNSINNYGNTPIITAARLRNFEIIELLIQYGARIDATDIRGDSVLQILAKIEEPNDDDDDNIINYLYFKISKLLWNIEK